MIVSRTLDSIKVVLSDAVITNQLNCYSSYTIKTGENNPEHITSINTNNTTDVVIVPGYTTDYVPTDVMSISIFNADTANATVTIKYVPGAGGEFVLFKQTIEPGQSIQYSKAEGFFLGGSIGEVINLLSVMSESNSTFLAQYQQQTSLEKIIEELKKHTKLLQKITN